MPNILKLTTEQQISAMRRIYGLIRTMNPARAFVYNYVGSLNADNQFAMQNTDGSYDPMWDVLLNDNHRTTTIPG